MNSFRSFLPSAAPDSADATAAAPKSPETARDAIVELLKLEGCEPRVDSDGDVVFTYKDFKYLLIFSRKDPEYIRLVLPNFWSIDSDSERSVAYAAANITNRSCKAAKICVEGEQTNAVIECFMAAPEQIIPVLLRSAGALEHAVRTFSVACTLQRGQ